MPFVPLPFVVALLLIMLFVITARGDGERPANRAFLALILVSAFQSVLSGLRWGYGVETVMVLAPLGAASVPPLTYAGVLALVARPPTSPVSRIALHAAPAVAILLLMMVWRDAIDAALVAIFVAYAIAILLLMRSGTDALRLAPFEGATKAYRAILFAAFALLLSAAIDTFVYFDLASTGGEYARPVIAIANLGLLAILAVAAASASASNRPAETMEEASPPDAVGDKQTLAALQTLMQTRHAYRDVDLNLDRLARKLGIPARQISTAVNRTTGKNVSQFVNEFRISEACTLLVQTDRPVTEIMFEVGFQTKSNFNREFRRVTGTAPLLWRDQKAGAVPNRD